MEEKLEYSTQNSPDPVEEFKKAHNGENYPDQPCYKAIKKYEAEQHAEWERHHKFIGLVKRACELCGYDLMNRIVLRDRATGKIWE